MIFVNRLYRMVLDHSGNDHEILLLLMHLLLQAVGWLLCCRLKGVSFDSSVTSSPKSVTLVSPVTQLSPQLLASAGSYV